MVFPDFLHKPVDEVAQKLLGCLFRRVVDGREVVVRIVETEAYDQNDAASHAYGGVSKRNRVMYGESGHLYVYLIYGIHYCCNVVTGSEGHGSGVLIRAVEPVSGQDVLYERRGMAGPLATNGPGKLCKAMGIDMSYNGHDLHAEPLQLYTGVLRPGEEIIQTTRIGISKEKERLRRFHIASNPFVSKY